jgi:hypothetical protein
VATLPGILALLVLLCLLVVRGREAYCGALALEFEFAASFLGRVAKLRLDGFHSKHHRSGLCFLFRQLLVLRVGASTAEAEVARLDRSIVVRLAGQLHLVS